MDHIEKDLPDQTWRRRDFSYANFFIIVYPYTKSIIHPFMRRVERVGTAISAEIGASTAPQRADWTN